jgi:hypothetical protein
VDLVGDVPALYWSRSPFNPAALRRKNQKEFDIETPVLFEQDHRQQAGPAQPLAIT